MCTIMKKRMIYFLIFSLLTRSLFAQITFEKQYVSSFGDFRINGVEQMPSQDYLVGGFIDDTTENYPFVMKTDPLGVMEWAKRVDTAGLSFKNVNNTSSGFIGTSTIEDAGGNNDMFFMEFDTDGNITDGYALGSSSSKESGYFSFATSDGGRFLVGKYHVPSGFVGYNAAYVVKLDASKNVEWSKKMDRGDWWEVNAAVETTDNGFVLASRLMMTSPSQFSILKLDASGNEEWNKTYTGEDYVYDIKETLDKGFIIGTQTYDLGVFDRSAYLLKIDSIGTLEWASTFEAAPELTSAYAVAQTNDSNYIFASYIDTNYSLIKVSASGDAVLWAYGYNSSVLTCSWVDDNNFKITQDNGFIFAGWSMSSPGLSNGLPVLIKTAPEGTTGCEIDYSSSISVTDVTSLVDTSSISYTESTENNKRTITPNVIDITATFSDTGSGGSDLAGNIICAPPTSYTWDNPCAGYTTHFYINDTSGLDSVHWDFDDGTAFSITAPPFDTANTYTSSGDYSVMFIQYYGTGTTDTITRTVTIYDLPPAEAGTDTAICMGDTITIGTAGIWTYAWNPATALSSAGIATPEAYPTVTRTYYLTVSDNECSNEDSVTIIINPSPTVNAGANDTICRGDTTQLNATGTGAFTWTPASGLSNNTIPQPDAFPDATTTYTVTADSNGCLSSDSLEIVVIPPPEAGPDQNISVCYNAAEFNLFDSLGTTNTSGTWQHPEGNPYSADYQGVFDPAADTTGNYYYILNTSRYCSDDTAVVSVTVYDLPAIVNSYDTNIHQGEQVTLSTPYNTNYQYSWTNNSGFSGSTSEETVTPETSTVYFLEVMDNNTGCKDTASLGVAVADLQLVIFNTFTPNNDGINDKWIITNINQFSDNQVEVFNRTGNLVFKQKNYDNTWNGSFEGKTVPAGTYYYIITTDNAGTKFYTYGSLTIIR